MRKVATYSFEAATSEEASRTSARSVLCRIDKWIRSKGKLSDDQETLVLRDGRMAEVVRQELTTSIGYLAEYVLTEPRPDGWFRTAISVGESSRVVGVAFGLSVSSTALAPVSFDVRCPRVVRELLSPPSPWRYKETKVSSAPTDYLGERGGEDFIALVWGAKRALPIVAVSDQYGSVLHPGIVERLAEDLAGLAVVARLDPAASWRVTRRKGKEWSCYGGAIRLYWPGVNAKESPIDHPLWTPRRLLASVSDTEMAADRIRRELRRRVLSQSPFAISEPVIIGQIRQIAQEERLANLRAKATEGADYKALAEEYFEELSNAHAALKQRDEEIDMLRRKVIGLQHALQSKAPREEEVEPETEVPPATVEEAVLIAMEECDEDLIFGGDVSKGVETLAKDAGPPEKILDYLRTLAELACARREGRLGRTMIGWLKERGVAASGESESVRNSRSEMQKRTWSWGDGGRNTFDLHLKPSDATAPDRCVRIYFDYDEERRKIIVGWVGRHP